MFKNFFEETSAADIAQATTDSKLLKKKKKEEEEVSESPVGFVGRTGGADADAHLDANPDLVRRFKKIIKELGGLTATRKLLGQLDVRKATDGL